MVRPSRIVVLMSAALFDVRLNGTIPKSPVRELNRTPRENGVLPSEAPLSYI